MGYNISEGGEIIMSKNAPPHIRLSDKHHVLFPRDLWGASKNARFLREKSGLIVPMLYYHHHSVLHKKCPPVALPTEDMLFVVCDEMAQMHFSDDPLKQIDNLLLAMNTSIKHIKRNQEYYRLIMELAMGAIEMQIPYIKDGMPRKYFFIQPIV